jgi:hypothetical protein
VKLVIWNCRFKSKSFRKLNPLFFKADFSSSKSKVDYLTKAFEAEERHLFDLNDQSEKSVPMTNNE